ncbi:hypothetical protein [Natronoglycomyces albus]|uniref:Uncharacterized protein n=1 Tax=Natronoglycomyces albus TaxID=2811108 RepID=A0A895XUM9_9ACTN|nr:hypothetical protein [Natronoglycomyces albus]QSB07173.1 hypothetical protein JQS30_17170 [Natronoglycomyces albus]
MAEFEPPWETIYVVEAESTKDQVAQELEAMTATLGQDLREFSSGSRLQTLRDHAERIRDHMDDLLTKLDRFDKETDQ